MEDARSTRTGMMGANWGQVSHWSKTGLTDMALTQYPVYGM